jgi:hypothetical protein
VEEGGGGQDYAILDYWLMSFEGKNIFKSGKEKV